MDHCAFAADHSEAMSHNRALAGRVYHLGHENLG
jgi:hypothetical protein